MANREVTFPFSEDSSRPLKSYKYKMEVVYIIGNTIVDVTKSMSGFTVTNRYKQNLYPVLKVDFVLKRSDVINIQRNSDKVVFRINLERFPIDQGSDNEEAQFGDHVWRNLVLTPIDLDLQPPPESQEGGNQDLEGGETSNQIDYSVYLFSEELLNMNRLVQDFVFNDCEVKDAILYLFNRYGAQPGTVLMNMPDNRQIYNQIIVPPYNFHNTIDYLQKNYGIYEFGTTFFMDYFTTYLLSNNIIDKTVVKSSEYKHFFIEFVSTQDSINGGQMSKYADDWKNERYYLRVPDSDVSIKDVSASNKDLIGEDLTILSRKQTNSEIDNFYTRQVSSDFSNGTLSINTNIKEQTDVYTNYELSQSSTGITSNSYIPSSGNRVTKQKFLWDNSSNDFKLTEYMHTLSKETKQLVMNLSDLNLEYFTPNRIFMIKFTDKEKEINNGVYQLTNLVYSFNTHGSNFFTISGICTFDKLTNISNITVKS